MIIKIDKDKLIDPLKNIVGVAEKKQTMPILGNVLFRTLKGSQSLLLVASDLEVEVLATVAIGDEIELNITVPAKKLLDILKSLPGDEFVEMVFTESKVTIRSGKSKFVLATLPGSDFPYSPTTTDGMIPIHAKKLDSIINQTAFSMAIQDARHFLNGLFMEITNHSITVVATDGHRLAMSATQLNTKLEETKSCIIPRKCIVELRRILSSFSDSKENIAEVSIKDKEIILNISNFTIKSRLIEGNYPDYKKVFPESLPHKLSTNKSDMKSALQRMAILSNDQFKGVKLSLNTSEITLSTNNPSQEEGEDSIPCTYSGDPFDVGFNLTYLLEVIDVVSQDDLEIQLNNSDSGCLVSSDFDDLSNKYIIMPMRV